MSQKQIARLAGLFMLLTMIGCQPPRTFAPTLEQKLTASDGKEGDVFGFHVSLDHNTLLVSARDKDVGATDTGGLYVFQLGDNGWEEQKILHAPDGKELDKLGDSRVMIQEGMAMAGAWGVDEPVELAGRFYIFDATREDWTCATLVPADVEEENLFGLSFDWDPVRKQLLIASMLKDEQAEQSGVVYIFENVNGVWTETGRIQPEDPQPHQVFGRYVEVQGDTLVITTCQTPRIQKSSPKLAGKVYVFEWEEEAWVQKAVLQPDDVKPTDQFARNALIDGDTIIVTAHQQSGWRGAVYVFERINGEWTQTAKLVPEDVERADIFGKSIALYGNRFAAASRYDNENGHRSGSVYLFEGKGGVYQQIAKIFPEDGQEQDRFGKRLDMDGERLVVGAHWDDDQGTNSGSVYVYRLWSE